jgi:hypothetical protein
MLFVWLLIELSVTFVFCEPVQYCKYGATSNGVDFCMGMLLHSNVSTQANDLYLTMSVSRQSNSSLGWTALGLGETMEGSLMFIVYGDPLSGESPIVSIRKSTGHHQPTLVQPNDMNGADLRVIRSDWFFPSSTTTTAMISVICYSCHLWPGTTVSDSSHSQPWIWAWNPSQGFDIFTYDAHLSMHAHHAGKGGWGNFYVDMPRSLNTWHNQPSFPPIISGVESLGTSSSPEFSMKWMHRNPLTHAHGIAMCTAFLGLFPAGVLAMRSGSKQSFKHHWVIQAIASLLTINGGILGLYLGHRIDTLHQVVGIVIILLLGTQGFLGWRHHVVFVRLHHRTWLSHAHIWLGRILLTGGWFNVMTGLILRGYSGLSLGVMGAFIGVEILSMGAWLYWKSSGKSQKIENDGVNYFTVGDDEYEEEASEINGQDKEKVSLNTN